MSRWPTLGGFVLALSLAAACSLTSPRPDLSKYYVLTSVTPATPPPIGRHPPVIGLGPVTLPGYLDHNEIVTRVGPNQLNLSDSDRWAEPVDQNFKNVLARDLGQFLGTDQIIQFPWYSAARLDYKVELNVSRFDADESGVATLNAKWVIRAARDDRVLLARTTAQTQQASSVSTGAEVAALSQSLGVLSQKIADSIVQVEAQNLQLSASD
ncbi:MAG TPA: PqiC family protein [Candidatus Binataceae bacterium]|nr:PqiC family protein [Candidatus Binataceae bacterium]